MREILSGALGTFAFSVLMQVPRRLLFFTTFGGLLSGTVYRFAEENGMGAFGATLWGMLAVALYAELLARVLKTPSTVLLYPSTCPCCPAAPSTTPCNTCCGASRIKPLLMLHKPYRSPRVWGLALCWWRCPSAYCARIENKNNAPYRDGPRARCIFYILFNVNGGYHLQSIRKTAQQTPAAPPPHTGGTNRQTAAHGKWQFLAPAPRSPLW